MRGSEDIYELEYKYAEKIGRELIDSYLTYTKNEDCKGDYGVRYEITRVLINMHRQGSKLMPKAIFVWLKHLWLFMCMWVGVVLRHIVMIVGSPIETYHLMGNINSTYRMRNIMFYYKHRKELANFYKELKAFSDKIRQATQQEESKKTKYTDERAHITLGETRSTQMFFIHKAIVASPINKGHSTKALRGLLLKAENNKIINVASDTKFLQYECATIDSQQVSYEVILPINNLRRLLKFGKSLIVRERETFLGTPIPDGWCAIPREEYEQWCAYNGFAPYIQEKYSDYQIVLDKANGSKDVLTLGRDITINAVLYDSAIDYMFFTKDKKAYGCGGNLKDTNKVLFLGRVNTWSDMDLEGIFIPVRYLRGFAESDIILSVKKEILKDDCFTLIKFEKVLDNGTGEIDKSGSCFIVDSASFNEDYIKSTQEICKFEENVRYV